MTNGEMIQKVFNCEVCEPIIEDDIIHVIFADKKDSAIGFDWSWWNAEYKESTTNNDLALIHTEGLDEEIRCAMCTNYMKSDRGCDGSCVVDKDMYKAVMDAIEKRIQPTTKNYSEVSSELDKNSKKLEKDFGELGCISRAQTQTEIEMNASRYTIAKERGGMGQVEWSDQLIKVSDAVDIIRHLPPVTPIRPKGHWVHGKELSKEYRGRILVDVTYADWHCSNCNYVIKGTVKPKWNYCPNCGAKMVEPQESEDI